ncbi:MAG: hypothetical protein AAF184_14265 [Pseudomonadota bacterium]
MPNRAALAIASLLTLAATAVAAGELVLSVEGFKGPEAVRYDPEQDVYFVANFNGEVNGDSNGFVSKVSPSGEILDLMFMTGTAQHPFHAGRGMLIAGASLWVADAQGVHEFDRRSGEHLSFVSLAAFEPGFPNDIAADDGGHLYVTDTGTSVLYRIAEGKATIAAKTPFRANGITRGPRGDGFLLAPWSGADHVAAWRPGTGDFSTVATLNGGGNFDGLELVDGKLFVASQQDQSLHVISNGADRMTIALAGKPADLGVDTKRKRLIVPYVALNRIDIITLAP